MRSRRLPLFQPLQFLGDMDERFMQRLEGARGPFVARTAEFLQCTQILGERRDGRHVGTRRHLRCGVSGICLHHRFRGLPGSLDNILVAGREIVFQRIHAALEFRGHACRLTVGLADQRREISDLSFEIAQRLPVVEGRGMRLLQALGDTCQAILEAIEARVRRGLDIARKPIDTAGEIVEALSQCIGDAVAREGFDLPGNVGKTICKIRLRAWPVVLQHRGKLVQALFQSGRRLLAGKVLYASCQRLDPRAEAGIDGIGEGVDLPGQIAEPVLQTINE